MWLNFPYCIIGQVEVVSVIEVYTTYNVVQLVLSPTAHFLPYQFVDWSSLLVWSAVVLVVVGVANLPAILLAKKLYRIAG